MPRSPAGWAEPEAVTFLRRKQHLVFDIFTPHEQKAQSYAFPY